MTVYSNRTKTDSQSGYGTGDIAIRIIMGLFWIIWESGFVRIICESLPVIYMYGITLAR